MCVGKNSSALSKCGLSNLTHEKDIVKNYAVKGLAEFSAVLAHPPCFRELYFGQRRFLSFQRKM